MTTPLTSFPLGFALWRWDVNKAWLGNVIYYFQLFIALKQVPHAIIFECIPPDGRVGDPGQWGFCRVQGGHNQCGPIVRRRSNEGMCAEVMLFWGLCLMCMIVAFLTNQTYYFQFSDDKQVKTPRQVRSSDCTANRKSFQNFG